MRTKEWKQDLPWELTIRKIDGAYIVRHKLELDDCIDAPTFRVVEEAIEEDSLTELFYTILEFFGESKRRVEVTDRRE